MAELELVAVGDPCSRASVVLPELVVPTTAIRCIRTPWGLGPTADDAATRPAVRRGFPFGPGMLYYRRIAAARGSVWMQAPRKVGRDFAGFLCDGRGAAAPNYTRSLTRRGCLAVEVGPRPSLRG